MRINIVTGFFLPVPPLLGGSTEKIWHELARRLAERKHEVTFLSRSWPGLPDRETLEGVKHRRINGADHTRSLARNLWLDLRWGLRAAPHLPVADVTICNTVTLPVWLGLARPSAGRVAAVVARMPKGQGRLYGAVDRIYALSTDVRNRLVRENARLTDKIRQFPYPIDWQLHNTARTASLRTEGTPITISYIGRLHPEKGLNLLLEAAAKLVQRLDLPPWRLVLTGPRTVSQGGGGEAYVTSLRESVGRTLGPRLQIRDPEFQPILLASLYAETDIFCYPSQAEAGETFGVAVAEAMAAGAAPVVSNLRCFRELIDHGNTGFVFDHRAPTAADDLCAQLADLIIDPARRNAIARKAADHVRQFDFGARSEALLSDLAGLTATWTR